MSEIPYVLLQGLYFAIVINGGIYLLRCVRRKSCEHDWFNMAVVDDYTHKFTGRTARICQKCMKFEELTPESNPTTQA